MMLLGACSPAATQSPTATPLPSETSTSTITPLPPTPTHTPTPQPSATPTITPTLEPLRATPPTIMLHRPSAVFDSVQFLADLTDILKQNEMHVVTYRDIYRNPAITAAEKGKLFIITIDDIYLPYPVDPHVLDMIHMLQQAGYPAVLGIITEGDYAYPETAALLKELSDSGWEIATHTNTHANLGEMEKSAPRYVYTEVSTSLDKIERVTGLRPITLILPEGQMVNDARFIQKAGIYWVVGINGGIEYDSRRGIVYVGRESPDGTADETFRLMKIRFGF